MGNRLRHHALLWVMLLSCAGAAVAQSVGGEPARPGTITGVVTDETGTAIGGATVTWSHEATSVTMKVATGMDGRFSLSPVPFGAYQLTVSSPGFADQTVSGVLSADGTSQLPPIRLRLAFDAISVNVVPTRVLAERQVRQEEQQRMLRVLPNYFVVYDHDAVPLTARQKFQLFGKSITDPADFAFTAIVAGVQQMRRDYSGFGLEESSYGKRYAAFYASIFTRSALDSAVLPSLLRQDPRYFYKGTGSTASRIGYAIGTAVVRKGDNGHWQPNYSNILGGLAAGALTNVYYPSQDRRGIRLTVENSGIAIATSAAGHLAQEFLFQKLTSHSRPAARHARDTP
jgi:hypothetical protein